MTAFTSDRERLEAAFRYYDEAFADHVGAIVTPSEYLDDDVQTAWLARVFMFAYGLGVLAGARTGGASDESVPERDSERERVEGVVETVVDIHESDEFDASVDRVADDLRDG